jgi:hypothetical protein
MAVEENLDGYPQAQPQGRRPLGLRRERTGFPPVFGR